MSRPVGDMDALSEWHDALVNLIDEADIECVDRVLVLAETASTQDAAKDMCGGEPGLLVLAGRQTAGRGRLGRVWDDTGGMGLAATFVLPAAVGESLPLLAGLAAVMTCAGALGLGPRLKPGESVSEAVMAVLSLPLAIAMKLVKRPAAIGLRWPNDVVETGRTARKLAGVLVEVDGPLAFVGVGINCHQSEADWPDALLERAVSLQQLGSGWSRREVAGRLVFEMERALSMSDDELADAWARWDVLEGSEREFEHDGRRVRGVVKRVEPTSEIVLQTPGGETVSLPARTTRLIDPRDDAATAMP